MEGIHLTNMCAQLHLWSANYSFKTNIKSYNGNYCGFFL